LQVLKSRGMAHSNQVREFLLSDQGIDLVDVFLSADRVLTGSARLMQEQQEVAATELRLRDHDRRLRELATRRKAIEAQIAALHADAEERAGEVRAVIERENLEAEGTVQRARTIAQRRGDASASAPSAASRRKAKKP
jgi:circadian clock protein KaiC